MSENQSILDILGDIDDAVISDAAVISKRKNRGTIKRIVTVSAAVLVFAVSAIAVKNGFSDTDYILPSETASSADTEIFSEKEYGTENRYTEMSTDRIPSEPPTSAPTTGFPYTGPDETTTEKEGEGSVAGEESPVIFIETELGKLISVSTDSVPNGYTFTEKTDIYTLEKIYGTKIIPSYLPEMNTGSELNEINTEEYPVHYNEDKTEVYCNNFFTFLLKNGSILTVNASTHPLTPLDAENENRYMASEIGNIPVLLMKGKYLNTISLYSAFFEKDGCCFRVQLSGILIAEEEFINIIESMI